MRLLAAIFLLLSGAASAAPLPTSLQHPATFQTDLAFPANQQEDYITVHGKRLPRFHPAPPTLKIFEDGHSERTIAAGTPFATTVIFGTDRDHDPTTGTLLKNFGQAYADSNPLHPR